MAASGRNKGLQTIFSFFLGLMVTALVGVGVYTFHPSPEPDFRLQLQDLNRQEEAVRDSRPPEQLTDADRAALQRITNDRNALQDELRIARESWVRSTSIVLIIFATLVMAVSLVRTDPLSVISNGLLLGGLFTMVYGVGWIVAAEATIGRFMVMTVAFAITLALGYARFARRRVAATPGEADVAGATELLERLRELEERMERAANALGPKSD